MITLIGGPYNGQVIEDSGAVCFKMAIYSGGQKVGSLCGVAIYEPNEARTEAFYLENQWDGTLEAIIPA